MFTQRNILQLPRQLVFVTLILVLITCFIPTHVHADPESGAHQLFLPVVTKTEVVTASEPACQLNDQEKRIEELVIAHPEQQRSSLTCNPKLASVARARAEDMGRRAYFAHVNPDGQGPNYFVRQTGYVLPDFYSQETNGNNIESIGAGPGDADGMWNAWMKSEKHTTHILGKTSFFAEQVEYGIGFAQVPGSPYQFYWVFISARPGP
ncbi:MAG: CAP domain-containing protein [Caldilineaceae bacterium]